MKQRWMSLLLTCLLMLSMTGTALADDLQGKSGMEVTFNGTSMKSNYSSSDLDETASSMQPGDSVTYTVTLKNATDSPTAWYISNTVRKAFEDNSPANGGAYTYQLTYTGPDGAVRELYNSFVTDGEGGEEGLHAASENLNNDRLSDYVFLDNMEGNSAGTITMKIALDGETQGNDYQETLADLKMNFAVEELEQNNNRPDGSGDKDQDHNDNNNDNNSGGGNNRSARRARTTRPVKTGDDSRLMRYIISAAISGLLLLLLALYTLKKSRDAAKKNGKKGDQ